MNTRLLFTLKRILISLIFGGVGLSGFAQSSMTLDSLLTVLENAESDTAKIHCLNQLTNLYLRKDFKQAKEYSERAIELSREAGFDSGLTMALNNLGVCLYRIGDFEKAQAVFEEKLELSYAMNDSGSLSRCLNFLGILSTMRGEMDKGVEYMLGSAEIEEKIGDKEGLGQAYGNIAAVYVSDGKYRLAIEYNTKAIRIFEEIENKQGIGKCNTNLSMLYIYTQDYLKARKASENAIAIFTELDQKADIAISLINLGLSYDHFEKPEIAIEHYERAREISEKLGNKQNLGYANLNLAVAYFTLGKEIKAMESIRIAKDYFEVLQKPLEVAKCIESEADFLRKQGKYSQAIRKYKEAVALAEQVHAPEVIKFSSMRLAEIYAIQGDYKKAYTYQIQHSVIKDSLLTEKKLQDIAELQTLYDAEKKEKENQALLLKTEIQEYENEIQSRRISRSYYLIFGLILLAILIFIISSLYLRQNKLKAQQHSSQLESKLLRSQMNPHFIFNSLTAIQSYIYTHETREAGKYLSDFASLMRLILENSRKEYISLETEIKTLTLYLDLQLLRFDHKFDYSITVDPELNIENVFIPPMFAQPFIENALEHGQLLESKKGKVDLSYHLSNDFLRMELKDNGIGYSISKKQERKLNHQPLATKITQERIQNLKGNVTGEILFKIGDWITPENEILGTLVTFEIPIIKA